MLMFILVIYYFIILIEESNASHRTDGLVAYSILSFDNAINVGPRMSALIFDILNYSSSLVYVRKREYKNVSSFGNHALYYGFCMLNLVFLYRGSDGSVALEL